MDNKTKCLCVAIAVLLASNGYLLYRLGNAEGIVHAFESSNEEPKAKDNTPIGKYIAEGDGYVCGDGMKVESFNLRHDGITEINDKFIEHWSRIAYAKGFHISSTPIHFRSGEVEGGIHRFTVKVDGNYLYITRVTSWEGNHSTKEQTKLYLEKDFIRYKRVE